jgi:hypothetical protein
LRITFRAELAEISLLTFSLSMLSQILYPINANGEVVSGKTEHWIIECQNDITSRIVTVAGLQETG